MGKLKIYLHLLKKCVAGHRVALRLELENEKVFKSRFLDQTFPSRTY